MKEQSGTIMSLPSALHCGEPSRWRKASRVLVLKTNLEQTSSLLIFIICFKYVRALFSDNLKLLAITISLNRSGVIISESMLLAGNHAR